MPKGIYKHLGGEKSTGYLHGLSYSRIYCIWHGMKARCLNSKSKKYNLYGGRGIKVCKRWLKFENFRDDMYASYLKHVKKFGQKNTSLDRINPNKGYSHKNCRWATCAEQRENRREIKKKCIECNKKFLTTNARETCGIKCRMRKWRKTGAKQ